MVENVTRINLIKATLEELLLEDSVLTEMIITVHLKWINCFSSTMS